MEKIKKGLLDLNFLDVQFDMEFDRLPHFTASGYDEAQFLISTNPGQPVRPLMEVASGGELSRIMLAIKTVLADSDDIPTLFLMRSIQVSAEGQPRRFPRNFPILQRAIR